MAPGRDLRVDFFRGLALVFMFWDHIPGNVLGFLTLRNAGFSDAAEIFVFLAGYGAALAYGKRLGREGHLATGVHILRRVWVLYVAHVVLLAQLIAMVFVTRDLVPARDLVQELGIGYIVTDPSAALLDGMLLRFKPGLMDPLPLYVVLLAVLALSLPAVVRWPVRTLVASAGVYLLAVVNAWNFSAQPQGVWFFNPLAWQLLFFCGVTLALHRESLAGLQRRLPPWVSWLLLRLALGVLVVCAFIAVSWHWPAWHDRVVPRPFAEWLYPIDKTNLAGVRLLHFLALLYCVARLVPQGRWLAAPWAGALCRLGQRSLPVFCLGVLLAPLADCANALADYSLQAQVITSVAGCLLMWLLAQVPHWTPAHVRRAY